MDGGGRRVRGVPVHQPFGEPGTVHWIPGGRECARSIRAPKPFHPLHPLPVLFLCKPARPFGIAQGRRLPLRPQIFSKPACPLGRAQGEHAHRIWAGIYSQPCFADLDNTEARVLHRLLSGMHASISMHLSAKWLIDEDAGEWGPNLKVRETVWGL
eukprot:366493-Chlamydomonas_euryale.AAC.4